MTIQVDALNHEPPPPNRLFSERQQHLIDQAVSLYESGDDRGTIQRVWSRLESAWKVNLSDPDFISSPSELALDGRDWVHTPPELEHDPELLAQIFPGINPKDLNPARFKNVARQSGYNWRKLTLGPKSDIPLLSLTGLKDSAQPLYTPSTTVAMFVLGNEGSLILKGKPLLDNPSQVTHLTGSTLDNRYVDIQYDHASRTYLLNPSTYLTHEYPPETQILYALPDELPKIRN